MARIDIKFHYSVAVTFSKCVLVKVVVITSAIVRCTSYGMSECLVIGPEGAGKTLLIRKLKECTKKRGKTNCTQMQEQSTTVGLACQEMNHTVPTVGINLEQLELSKNTTCSLRESGGQMAPLWSGAYKQCNMVIYVIDSSNLVQVSVSTILLLDALSSEDLREKPVLVFFNKTDAPLGLGLVEYKSVMRMDNILLHATQSLTVVDGSCWTGKGLK